jgi:hypothetical protein
METRRFIIEAVKMDSPTGERGSVRVSAKIPDQGVIHVITLIQHWDGCTTLPMDFTCTCGKPDHPDWKAAMIAVKEAASKPVSPPTPPEAFIEYVEHGMAVEVRHGITVERLKELEEQGVYLSPTRVGTIDRLPMIVLAQEEETIICWDGKAWIKAFDNPTEAIDEAQLLTSFCNNRRITPYATYTRHFAAYKELFDCPCPGQTQ